PLDHVAAAPVGQHQRRVRQLSPERTHLADDLARRLSQLQRRTRCNRRRRQAHCLPGRPDAGAVPDQAGQRAHLVERALERGRLVERARERVRDLAQGLDAGGHEAVGLGLAQAREQRRRIAAGGDPDVLSQLNELALRFDQRDRLAALFHRAAPGDRAPGVLAVGVSVLAVEPVLRVLPATRLLRAPLRLVELALELLLARLVGGPNGWVDPRRIGLRRQVAARRRRQPEALLHGHLGRALSDAALGGLATRERAGRRPASMVQRRPVREPEGVPHWLDRAVQRLAQLRRPAVEDRVVQQVRPADREVRVGELVPAPGVVGRLRPVAEDRLEVKAADPELARQLLADRLLEVLERAPLLERRGDLVEDGLHRRELEAARDPERGRARLVVELAELVVRVGHAASEPAYRLLEALMVGCDVPRHGSRVFARARGAGKVGEVEGVLQERAQLFKRLHRAPAFRDRVANRVPALRAVDGVEQLLEQRVFDLLARRRLRVFDDVVHVELAADEAARLLGARARSEPCPRRAQRARIHLAGSVVLARRGIAPWRRVRLRLGLLELAEEREAELLLDRLAVDLEP